MKTVFRFTAIALCACLSFSACKKDKGDDNGEIKNSTKSVEQNKADIQQAGIDLSKELDAMKDGKAFNALLQLANLQKNGELKSYVLKSTDVDAKLKGFNESEELDELANTIEEMSGAYEWDAAKGEFTKTGDKTNAVSYKFPYSSKSTSNDCEVEATVGYASNIKNMPANVNCSLKINGTECLNLSYVGTFSNEGYPNSITETMTVDDYSLSTNYTRSNSDLKVSVSFLHGTKTLLSVSNTIEGNLTDENFDKLMADFSRDDDEVDGADVETDDATDYDLYTNVLSKITFSTQVMNFKFVGSAATKSIAELSKKIDEREPATQAEVQALVDAANNAIDCYVLNVSENAKIASIKLFVVKDEYDETAERYEAEPMLVFPDESKMTFEDYFKTGFNEVGKAFEDMAKDFQEALEQYDLIGSDDGGEPIIDDNYQPIDGVTEG
jgi:hypothetical protein